MPHLLASLILKLFRKSNNKTRLRFRKLQLTEMLIHQVLQFILYRESWELFEFA
jgi:hypothetical protein